MNGLISLGQRLLLEKKAPPSNWLLSCSNVCMKINNWQKSGVALPPGVEGPVELFLILVSLLDNCKVHCLTTEKFFPSHTENSLDLDSYFVLNTFAAAS